MPQPEPDPTCYKRPSNALAEVAALDADDGGIVAKRDKWQCQLCGKKVNSGLVYPHPMSWSLDHVIPIARGGEHSYANTQLAHLLCNSRKHATIREPQQLALIG